MYYQDFFPNRALQEYVLYFWILEDFEDNSSLKSFKIIPDGVPALIFQETSNFFISKKGQISPQLYVYGQYSKYTEHNIRGKFRIIGAYLRPTALKTIFNIDAFEFNNQNIPLEDVVTENILEQLINTNSLNHKIEIISNFFLNQIQKVKINKSNASFASDLIQKGKTLKEVQFEMKLSERSLERLIKQYVGMSPKMFSRIMRFQSGLNTLRKDDFESFTKLSYENEYFDQSHYVREFKEFTGTSPKSYLLNTNEILRNFPQMDFNSLII